MTQSEFRNILHEVWLKSSTDFSGMGIILCDNAAKLPILNLRDTTPDMSGTLIELLIKLSSKISEYHDGFHILNGKGELTHAAQYFSPPIERRSYFDRSRLVGGRFVAALFGSAIPEVTMTGIISEGNGLSIFENGQEVHFEELK